MSRKRKICCGLSSCCGKTRSESADMIAGKSSNQPMTRSQKCGKCCCLPFQKVGNFFKRRKVDTMGGMSKEDSKPSMWERLCCCSSCCKRCRKGNEMDSVKEVSIYDLRMNYVFVDLQPACIYTLVICIMLLSRLT